MWFALGLVLLVIELATPSGFFVMFFGLGALTVGVLDGLNIGGPPWMQWLVFTVTSVAYLLLFRDRLRKRIAAATPTTWTRSSARSPSRENGSHLATSAGSSCVARLWTARNERRRLLEPGQRCRVIGVDGLHV